MPVKQLRTRELGKNGSQVLAIGFGAMSLGAPSYGKLMDDDSRLQLLDRLYETGCTNRDTSDALLTRERNQIFLGTKFSHNTKEDGTREFRNEPDWIRMVMDRDLKNLQTDYIDLWYCHRLKWRGSIETIVETMVEAVKTNFPLKNVQLAGNSKILLNASACKPGQLTLSWLLRQGDDIIPILGTKRTEYLDENLPAMNLRLTDDEDKEIRDAVDNTKVHGDGYPGAFDKMCFADTPSL